MNMVNVGHDYCKLQWKNTKYNLAQSMGSKRLRLEIK